MAEISKISDGSTTWYLRDRNYCVCDSSSATKNKTAALDGFELVTGACVKVKILNTNTAESPTLNINSTGAASMLLSTGTNVGITPYDSWANGAVVTCLYDGNNWILVDAGTPVIPQAYIYTASNQSAKKAVCTGYALVKNTYIMVIVGNTNSYNGALTLSIQNTIAKPIYINGNATSSTNYGLVKGCYLVFYDGTNYYFRTDGKMTGDITGNAATVNGHTVASDVPANAVFTDTVYELPTASASTLGGVMVGDNLRINNGVLTSSTYATCSTSASTAAKTVSMDGFSLVTGSMVTVRFDNTNTAVSPTLNVNSTGAKQMMRYGTVPVGTATDTSWTSGSVITFVYDGTYWIMADYPLRNNTIPQAYLPTATASNSSKNAQCSEYADNANSYIMVLNAADNSYAGAFTLNINSQGAYPVYINGSASSDSNYTLPAGSYLVFFDGTNYYFRTDGKITGDITGDSATVNGHTVATDVPSNAVFTDTTYTASSPITITNGEITHDTSGVTAGSKGQTAAQTPSWGGTFKALSATVDAEGHVTAIDDHNVTIPSSTASTTAAGLMSAADKTAVNALGNVSTLTYTVVSTF